MSPATRSGARRRTIYLVSTQPRSKRVLHTWTKTLEQLDQIPFEQLSAEEKINAGVFRTMIQDDIGDVRYKTYEAPFNADTFFWTNFTPREGFATADEYRRYLGRIADVPRYFDEHITNMRAGLKRGYSVPKVSVTGRDRTIEPYLEGGRHESFVCAVQDDARLDCAGRAGAITGRRTQSDRREGGASLCEAARLHPQGISGQGARPRWLHRSCRTDQRTTRRRSRSSRR